MIFKAYLIMILSEVHINDLVSNCEGVHLASHTFATLSLTLCRGSRTLLLNLYYSKLHCCNFIIII